MKKVSFDFDGTLTKPAIEQYAKRLIELNIEVWICTSRLSPEKAPTKEFNDDLFLVADRIGIKRSNIIFTCHEDKSEFLNRKGFSFHLDDDNIELSFIKTDTDVKPIYLFGNKDWLKDCDRALVFKYLPFEDEIFEIITDLIRQDISKETSLNLLSDLYIQNTHKILEDIINQGEEVICTTGLRFNGTHQERIKQVFNDHGVEYQYPF